MTNSGLRAKEVHEAGRWAGKQATGEDFSARLANRQQTVSRIAYKAPKDIPTPMIKIASDRLVVELLEPGSAAYARTRFDWTGFITQVILDGKHTVCVPESPIAGEGTGGIGLCSEFGSSIPVGYDDAAPGEKFPKFGVGVLERVDDTEYSSFYPYPNTPYPIRVETETSAVTFTVDPIPVRGYAVRLTKRVEVVENHLLIRSRLHNLGEKRIVTQEYNHNFVGIDNAPIGPDYTLNVPFDIVTNREIPYTVENGTITWPAEPKAPIAMGLTGSMESKHLIGN